MTGAGVRCVVERREVKEEEALYHGAWFDSLVGATNATTQKLQPGTHTHAGRVPPAASKPARNP